MFNYQKILGLAVAFTAFLCIPISCSSSVDSYESERPVEYKTLQAFGTPVTVYDYQGQVTDGKLKLSAQTVSSGCKGSKEATRLKLIFHNLTPYPIVITSKFKIVNGGIGGGNLTTVISDTAGKHILTLADVNISSDTFYVPENDYKTIDGNTSEEFIVDYFFPNYVVTDVSEKTLSTPTPGHYMVKFVYSDYIREIYNWEGTISSNLVTVCLK